MKLQFDSVFYYVRDLDRSVAFYAGVLELPLRSRDAVARFDVDGVLFELVPTTEAELVAGRGNARICFAVEDLNQAAAELEARGVAVGPVRTVASGLVATFQDLDGNELALWQPRPGGG